MYPSFPAVPKIWDEPSFMVFLQVSNFPLFFPHIALRFTLYSALGLPFQSINKIHQRFVACRPFAIDEIQVGCCVFIREWYGA